ncbi:MAG: type II toxin-antitoxin system VapC family toxin [Bacteroidota bacterium]
MADKIVMVDTSVLIDYYRKTDKEKTIFIKLVREQYRFAISSITKYEIYSGATSAQLSFWDDVLRSIDIIPFDGNSVDTAVKINTELKRKRKQIDLADLFIAASPITHDLPLATLNKKHFERIDTLVVL